jgi:1,4-dihydroxy-2-naphthoyl-CoA hydrolase
VRCQREGSLQSDGDVQAHLCGATPHPEPALSGWFGQIGLEIVRASPSEVLAEWTISERHLQPHGIVHGGVYASVVESCCSIGAVLAAPPGKQVVGVENHTSFLRPARAGRLRARAIPLHAGRQAQLWECAISDEGERLIATGRLRVFCVDPPGAGRAGAEESGGLHGAGGR